MFEKTRWMLSKCYHEDKSLYFRKEFTVTGKVKKAEIFLIILGQGECRINGENITDEVYITPYTRFDMRVYYKNFDVTHLVKQGVNAIGIHAGNGYFNSNMSTWNESMATWREKPRALVNLFITLQSGEQLLIKSDNSWKSDFGCCVYNQVRRGEIWDARLKVPYDMPGFDDSKWQNTEAVAEPGGIYLPFNMEPIRITDELKPVSVKNNVYDFGVNISGRIKITVTGEAGAEIKIKRGEALGQDGKISDKSGVFAQREGFKLVNEDIFILSGNDNEEFMPVFGYSGFRYAEVTNAPKNFKITAQVIHTDLKKIGEFYCSDDMINKIHNASVRSTLNNYHGIPEDCPHREQNGWLADAYLSQDQAMMNFDMVRAYKKFIYDISDVQRVNGQLSGIAPISNWGYNCGVSWTSGFIILAWNLYKYSGDTEMLNIMWDRFKLYTDYVERMSYDYITEIGYNDWCAPKETTPCSAAIINTAYLHTVFVLMAKIAKLLGKDGNDYAKKAELVKKAWLNEFWNKDEWQSNKTYLACALYHGFLDSESEIKQTVQKIVELIKKSDYHLDVGIFGIKYIFNVLGKHGYNDILYKCITNPTYPSYAYWILSGMTTFCEAWDMRNSLNHHMFSEVDNWFYRYIAGIKCEYGKIEISPAKIAQIDKVNAYHKDIRVEINGDELKVDVPDKATVKWNGAIHNVEKGRYLFNKMGGLL